MTTRTISLAALAFGTLGSLASAQTLYGFDATTNTVVELTNAPCTSPVVGTFPSNPGFMCATAASPAAPVGDIAVDKINDDIWVTDGVVLTGYSAQTGAPFASLQILTGYLPGMFTGLGMDSSSGTLWATDGVDAVQFFTPFGCFGAGFSLGLPFTIPSPGTITDIAFDPLTGTLWSCDDVGNVVNFDTAGTFLSGFISFPSLTGIDVDTATGNLFLTDGTTIAYLTPTGVPAPTTFYADTTTFVVPGGTTLRGLAFSANPVVYGAAADSSGLSAPTMATRAQALSPSPSFRFRLLGSQPGASAFLYRSTGALCPPFLFGGVLPVNITVSPFILVGTATADGAGNAFVNAPLPAGIPTGFSVYSQWLVLTSVPSTQVSEGAHFTICAP